MFSLIISYNSNNKYFMASFDYNPIADSIKILWVCPECGHENCSEFIPPKPNLAADTDRESQNSEWFEEVCANCDHQINVTLCTGMWSSYGEIDVDDENLKWVDDVIDSDDYYDNEMYLESHTETDELLAAVDSLEEDVRKKLYSLLYANIISKMEAFLCDTIVKYVMANENHKQKFVQTYKPLAEQKFPMSAIYSKYNSLDMLIKDALTNIIYHKTELVKKLYKDNIGIDIQPDDVIIDAINIRHDIVHRNGKDKEGNPCDITKTMVEELSTHVKDYIEKIEISINSINIDDRLKSLL